MKFLVLLFLLSGCVADTSNRITQIESNYKTFVSDCNLTGGELQIDKPFNKRRVQNEPITVWEMKAAVCYYEDAYPIRMDY